MDKLIEYLLKKWSVIKQPPLSYAALDSRLREALKHYPNDCFGSTPGITLPSTKVRKAFVTVVPVTCIDRRVTGEFLILAK